GRRSPGAHRGRLPPGRSGHGAARPRFEAVAGLDPLPRGGSVPVATRDFYNILGVGRDATPDDIKRAYRSLARRWHPDHNRGPDAEARFKDITEAYRILSDPDERARYDRLGPLYTADGRPPTPEDLNEVVGSVLGGLFRRRGREPGEDLRYTISL